MKNSNEYSWNQILKFSWGHIIAFLALIFMSYVMYMGDFYANGGDFQNACIKVGVTDLLLLFVFMGAQRFKAAEVKFNRKIIYERIFIVLCPIAFAVAMVPYNHFWSVFEQRSDIEIQFTKSINSARNLFENYEIYANERIAGFLKSGSDWAIKTRDSLETQFLQCKESCMKKKTACVSKCESDYNTSLNSFLGDSVDIECAFTHALKLQLLSENTDSLRNKAINWIDDANQGASVWNAFLIGNIDVIAKSIENWHKTLQEFSTPVYSVEIDPKPFDVERQTINDALEQIHALKNIYQETTGVKINAIWTGLILFLMLLFPYIIQRRNTKAAGYYFLIPRREKQTATLKDQRENLISQKKTEEKVEIAQKGESLRVNTNESAVQKKTKTYDDSDPYSGTF